VEQHFKTATTLKEQGRPPFLPLPAMVRVTNASVGIWTVFNISTPHRGQQKFAGSRVAASDLKFSRPA
jgi:hypothetical protein